MPTCTEIIDRCQQEDLDLVRLVYVGNDGVLRGKAVTADRMESVLDSGVNVPKVTQSFTSLDRVVPNGRFVGQGEARLLPDPETFRVLPYADKTAIALCEIREVDGNRWTADPRSSLRTYLETMQDNGYTTRASLESEFSLVRQTEDGLEPNDRSLGYSVDNMQETHGFVIALVEALQAQGIEIESYVPEYGAAQQELVVKYAPGLRAADRHILFRHTVRAIATNQDRKATFLPKPFSKAGNGCHLNLSLWEDNQNLFYDAESDDPFGLSETGRHFVGGVLEHVRGLAALTAPTVMSYDRLKPGKWASAYACWGHDNREATIRIPSARSDQRSEANRIEYKPADNTLNPYLALLGLLAAGMDGIENRIQPPDSVPEDPSALSVTERDRRGIERLPQSLEEALNALEDDDVLLNALGDDLATSYLEVKYDEWEAMTDDEAEWSLAELMRAF